MNLREQFEKLHPVPSEDMNAKETVFRVVMVFAVLAFVLLLVVLQLATDPMLAVVLTAVFAVFCAVALEWLEPAQEFEDD